MAERTSLDRIAKSIAKDMAREIIEKKEEAGRKRRQRAREERQLAMDVGKRVLRHCRKSGIDPNEFVSGLTEGAA